MPCRNSQWTMGGCAIRKVFLGVLGTGLAILCIVAVVEGESGNTLLPEGMTFPNPMRNIILRGQSVESDSIGARSEMDGMDESKCGISTDYLAITDGEGEGEGEECGYEEAALYSNGPDSALLDASNGSAMLVGRTGVVAVGSNEDCDFTPGVALLAYPESSTAYPEPAQAGLLLSTCPNSEISLAWLAAMREGSAPSASLIMMYSSVTDSSCAFMLSDSISMSNNDVAGINISNDNRVSVCGETVNIHNQNAGVLIEPNGSVTIRLGSSE